MSQVNIGYAINGAFPTTVGGTGTTVKYWPNVPGPSIGVSNTTPSSTSSNGQLNVPGANKLNGQLFEVAIVGAVSIDPSISCPSVEVALYANTAANGATPSYTKIATTGAVTPGNTDFEAFRLSLAVSGDTLSGILQGSQTAYFNGSLQNSTPKALTANLSGLNFATDPVFGLVAGITFGTSGAKNLGTLWQFSLSS